MALRVSLELADGPSSYQIRIERVPQRVAQQVDGHDGDEEGRAGAEREPVARVDELPALGERAAPRRGRQRHAEAGEREPGPAEDRALQAAGPDDAHAGVQR